MLSNCWFWFDVPLTDVATPAFGLQVVLVPPDRDERGLGGASGAPTEPFVFPGIAVQPVSSSKRPPGTTFDLLEPADRVFAGDRHEPLLYVDSAGDYGVARVELRQGEEVLASYRGLYSREPTDLCVK